MDVTILRIALYEMIYVDNVPNRVALNEAIELAKTLVMISPESLSTVFYRQSIKS